MRNVVEVKIINKSPHPIPEYTTEGASGMDIRAWIPDSVHRIAGGPFKSDEKPFVNIRSGTLELIPTGIHVAIPDRYEIQVRSRSGLAVKHNLQVLNTPGTVDSDYIMRCEFHLYNQSQQSQVYSRLVDYA